MAKWFNRLMLLLNAILMVVQIYVLATRGLASDPRWTPVEIVTIVLTAIGLLVAGLGIFLAILAIWGYARLSEEARVAASSAAKELTGSLVPRLVIEELQRSAGAGPDLVKATAEAGGPHDGGRA